MELLAAATHETSMVFIELGLAVVGLAILSRVASRFGFSAIPFYLLAGLAFGNGGLLPLKFGEEFVRVGAEVGVILLLFMLGLEYTGEKLVQALRTGYLSGLVDIVLNFTPGVIVAVILKMPPLAAVVLGGITYISSSGVIAKILNELKRMSNPETPLVITLLVLEDLAMAIYLPILAVLLSGKDVAEGAISVFVALATVSVILFAAVRFGKKLSQFVSHQSDEVVLLSTFGLVMLMAGLSNLLQVSGAVAAFLVGVAVSGPLAHRAERLFSPLRDLFAATFFLFFGLQINPATLPAALPVALGLAIVTATTKFVTANWAGVREGLSRSERMRAGATLVARGEFSIVIAGLGAAVHPKLGPLAATYVLLLAIIGPILARFVGRSKPAPLAPS